MRRSRRTRRAARPAASCPAPPPQVVHCRRVLKWTYATAYYTFEESAGASAAARQRMAQHQEFFEFNQARCGGCCWVEGGRWLPGAPPAAGRGARHACVPSRTRRHPDLSLSLARRCFLSVFFLSSCVQGQAEHYLEKLHHKVC